MIGRMAQAALAIATVALVPASAFAQAPLRGAGKPHAIEGAYIVVMKSGAGAGAADRAQRRARSRGGRVGHEYARALRGFSARLSDQALTKVRSDPAVAYVEPDARISLAATQSEATFGLDRIDQRDLPPDSTYTYDFTGEGVTVYIIDTGIRTSHTQFGGRAISGADTIDGLPADDCNGHGTHVAGTVGAADYGVAKEANLVAVRVLDCTGEGSLAAAISGVEFVTGNHQAGQPAVANMSFAGSASAALDQAVATSIADGVTYVAAAGNTTSNACNLSPARARNALTVGATDSGDRRAPFSNFGTCLDVFAPGVNITSSWITSDTATETISGTSMAAPHVAGVAALYLDRSPAASPATVGAAVVGNSTLGHITNVGTGSPNRLLYSRIVGPPPASSPPPSGSAPAPRFVAPDFAVFTASPKTMRASKTGRITYSFVATPGSSGKASLRSTKKIKVGTKKRTLKVATKSFTAPLSGKIKLKFKLSAKNLKALKRVTSVKFRVNVTVGATPFTATVKVRRPKKS